MLHTQVQSRPHLFISAKTSTAIPARHPLVRDALVQASLDPQVRAIDYLPSTTVDATPVALNAIVTYGVDAPPNAHQRREIFGTDLDRALDQRGLRACGVYYQSAALQEWRRKVGDTTVCLRHDPSDIGHVSVWIGEQWLTVPSVRDMFRGLDLSTWLMSVRDLKRRYAANAKIHEKIALAAVRAISAMAEDAMRRTSIDATRLTRDELDREERHLFLGFDIVDDVDPDDVSLKSNILDGGVAVKSATTPTQPIQHPQPQDGSANEADDFGLED